MYYPVLLFLCLTISSCTLFMPLPATQSVPTVHSQKLPLAIPVKSKDGISRTFYNKHSKFITSRDNIRYVERMYYGPRADILKEFADLDTRKEISKDEYTKFPIASFFSANAISIPADKKEKAESLYSALIDTILSKTMFEPNRHIEIVVLGYTDETLLEDNVDLYNTLLVKSQHEHLSKQEFYTYTSYFRAKEIGDILSSLLEKRKVEFQQYNKLMIDIIQEGRGIEYPEIKREYDTVDDKRRIAKVYWKLVE